MGVLYKRPSEVGAYVSKLKGYRPNTQQPKTFLLIPTTAPLGKVKGALFWLLKNSRFKLVKIRVFLGARPSRGY